MIIFGYLIGLGKREYLKVPLQQIVKIPFENGVIFQAKTFRGSCINPRNVQSKFEEINLPKRFFINNSQSFLKNYKLVKACFNLVKPSTLLFAECIKCLHQFMFTFYYSTSYYRFSAKIAKIFKKIREISSRSKEIWSRH